MSKAVMRAVAIAATAAIAASGTAAIGWQGDDPYSGSSKCLEYAT